MAENHQAHILVLRSGRVRREPFQVRCGVAGLAETGRSRSSSLVRRVGRAVQRALREDHDLVVAVVLLLVATEYDFICTTKEIAVVVVVVVRKHQNLFVDERRVEDLDIGIRVRLLRLRGRIADQVEDFDVAVLLVSRAV